MRLIPIPCLADNYAYLVIDPQTQAAVVVDPSDGPAVAKALKQAGVRLVAIWNTHHHWDHTGGNAYLCDHFSDLAVYGSAYDAQEGRIPRQTHALDEGDRVCLGDLAFDTRAIPGHTLGHIAYVGAGALLCGDTLFVGGCGRLFEGTPEMMVNSLAKLRTLSPETLVYCGHEYTAANLAFALSIEPNFEVLKEAYARALAARAAGLGTVPSRIADERLYNPFLRFDDPVFQLALSRKLGKQLDNPIAVFAATRDLKDRF